MRTGQGTAQGTSPREVVLDTETTGLDPDAGDRVVEIGAVELVNHMPTGRHFHAYINPERPMPEEAFRVHGLGDDFLRDKPVFAAVAGEFLRFLGDAPLVIHNAAFDMRFLNAEIARLGHPPMPLERAVDTVGLARRKFPGSPASLDALCRRFGIDSSARTLHGALLDSEILAEVYLELIGGRQPDLGLAPGPRQAGDRTGAGMGDGGDDGAGAATGAGAAWRPRPRPAALPPRLAPAEAAAHAALVEAMGPGALWLKA